MDLDMKVVTDLLCQGINRSLANTITCIDAMGYTGTGRCSPVGPSADKIIKTIQEYQDKLNQPPTIKVPRGDDLLLLSQSEYPTIALNELINDEDCYIMTGFGVVCGKSAYDKMWEYGYIAVWTGKEPELTFTFTDGWRE